MGKSWRLLENQGRRKEKGGGQFVGVDLSYSIAIRERTGFPVITEDPLLSVSGELECHLIWVVSVVYPVCKLVGESEPLRTDDFVEQILVCFVHDDCPAAWIQGSENHRSRGFDDRFEDNRQVVSLLDDHLNRDGQSDWLPAQLDMVSQDCCRLPLMIRG
jgi:hypothetical protein